MSYELILIVGFLAVLAATAYHAVISLKRGLSVTSPTTRGMRPAAAWQVAPPRRRASDKPFENTRGVHELAVPTKTEAEDLLDWMEANGYQHLEVSYQPGRGFIVHYVRL
jgi:hypothetical protein